MDIALEAWSREPEGMNFDPRSMRKASCLHVPGTRAKWPGAAKIQKAFVHMGAPGTALRRLCPPSAAVSEAVRWCLGQGSGTAFTDTVRPCTLPWLLIPSEGMASLLLGLQRQTRILKQFKQQQLA